MKEAPPVMKMEEPAARKHVASQWTLMWWKLKDHKVAYFSLYIVIFFYLMIIFCDFLAPNDPQKRNAKYKYAPPQRIHLFHEGRLRWPFIYPVVQHRDPDTLRLTYNQDRANPAAIHFFGKGDPYKLLWIIPTDRHLITISDGNKLYLLGADKLGRDLFSRILYGGRISLSIGLIGMVASLLLGVSIGGISGFYGGVPDTLIQRSIEVLQSFPGIPLWLALSAAMPAAWSQTSRYFCMTLILAVIGWTGIARVVRGKILALREEDYAVAAQVAGVKEFRIIMRHLVPGFLSHLIVTVTMAIPGMILGETALSFLGLGMRPPAISWGVLLNDAQNITAIGLYPWLMSPAAFVIVVVLAFNFLGDGLRDAADPYKS